MLGRNKVRVLHAASIAAGIGSVATAADVTVFGGTGTAIAAGLSGVELFRNSDGDTQDFATRFAVALDASLAACGLSDDRKKITIQMLAKFPPTEMEIARADRQAPQIVAALCVRIKAVKSQDYSNDQALGDFREVMVAALKEALSPQTTRDATEQVLLDRSTEVLRVSSENREVIQSISASVAEIAKTHTERAMRDAEARKMMLRFELEEIMEQRGTSYTEVIKFLELLSDLEISLAAARRRLTDGSND